MIKLQSCVTLDLRHFINTKKSIKVLKLSITNI